MSPVGRRGASGIPALVELHSTGVSGRAMLGRCDPRHAMRPSAAGLRGQDTNPAARVHDAWGLSLGANLGRYWGLELSADAYELRVKSGSSSVGEYGVIALVPQLRLRYPLFGDRPRPYVVGRLGPRSHGVQRP